VLKALGRRATRIVHGDRRSSGGLLLTGSYYLEDDQEWRLGQSYVGLLGFPFFALAWTYVYFAYADAPRHGHRLDLGHWSQLGPDVKILLPLMIIGHLGAMASAIRLFLVRAEIAQQPRSEIEP
jgi:hypothetical protein